MSNNIGYIYILEDNSGYTKIGITENLDSRLKAYNTHNPNYKLYNKYICNKNDAKNIENAVKARLKNSVVSGQEWFSVSANHVDKIVNFLLNDVIKDRVVNTPAMHGIKVDEETKKILRKINTANWETIDGFRNQVAKTFAKKYNLGIPWFELDSEKVEFQQSDKPDLKHCNPNSEILRKSLREQYCKLDQDDRIKNFYHLLRLSTGCYVAICTSRVSMPYKKDYNDYLKLQEQAKDLGWVCTFHNDWSWHLLGKTDLILYHSKTPINEIFSQWEISFKKWVIENRKLLGNKELEREYLNKFFDIDEDFIFKDEFTYLIKLWKDKVDLLD